MSQIFQNTAFGVALTLVSYEFGKWLQRKTGIKVLSPLITAAALIIGILLVGNISYGDYQFGASIVGFFIGPATVSFAIPLYKNLRVIKENFVPIIVGILGGLITGLISTYVLCKAFGINEQVFLSMIPKTVTSAIGFSVSEMIGGTPEITLVLIVIAGTAGYVFGEFVFKILKIDDPIIKGISFGTNSHITGTAKAMEIGEKEGALSSAAIAVAGIIMVFLAPLFIKIVSLL